MLLQCPHCKARRTQERVRQLDQYCDNCGAEEPKWVELYFDDEEDTF